MSLVSRKEASPADKDESRVLCPAAPTLRVGFGSDCTDALAGIGGISSCGGNSTLRETAASKGGETPRSKQLSLKPRASSQILAGPPNPP